MIYSIIDPIAKVLGDWSIEMNLWSILFRLALAFIAGAFVGMERSAKQHTAGLRTTLLISVGSCIAMLINVFLQDGSDLTRLAAGVLSGIGFIGAGTIVVNSRQIVTGVTSAASIFVSAVLGLAFGCGLYTVGIIGCIIVIIILVNLSSIETKFKKNSFVYNIHVELNDAKNLTNLLDLLRDYGFKVRSINHDVAYFASNLTVYTFGLMAKDRKNFIKSKDLIHEIRKLDYVHYAEVL